MISPTVTLEQMKRGFFDRAGVLERMATERGRAIRRVMLLTRVIAKRSLRVRPYRFKETVEDGRIVRRDVTRYSRPGQPPHVRSSDSPLKRLLFAAYDTRSDSGVAGPAKYARFALTPRVLEEGGNATREVYEPGPVIGVRKWKNQFGSGEREIRGKGRTVKKKVRLAARPYMAPAFRGGLEKVPQEFRDILHRGGDL